MANVHEFSAKRIDGTNHSLAEYQGKVVLVVNVASRCGYTPQYKGLEALYRAYKDRGFVVLGFPANEFGAQEPGSDAEIQTFCSTHYDVTFDMFSKVVVKGEGQAPLFQALTAASGGDIKWNFTKFLVGRSGEILGRFESKVDPESAELKSAVEEALSA